MQLEKSKQLIIGNGRSMCYVPKINIHRELVVVIVPRCKAFEESECLCKCGHLSHLQLISITVICYPFFYIYKAMAYDL